MSGIELYKRTSEQKHQRARVAKEGLAIYRDADAIKRKNAAHRWYVYRKVQEAQANQQLDLLEEVS